MVLIDPASNRLRFFERTVHPSPAGSGAAPSTRSAPPGMGSLGTP
ncbi:MAG: hypothetical protein JWP18_1008, partial [Solirubrobacterales bacterium]|nr:hypothetical protein [Solirubrobacterales bacterium]